MRLKKGWILTAENGAPCLQKEEQRSIFIPVSPKEAVALTLMNTGKSLDETVDLLYQWNLIRKRETVRRNLQKRFLVFFDRTAQERKELTAEDIGDLRELLKKTEKESLSGEEIYPRSMKLILTDRCQGICRYCYASEYIQNTERKMELSLSKWREILDQAEQLGIGQLFILGGEPFDKEGLFQLVEYAADKGMYSEVLTKHELSEKEVKEWKNIPALFLRLILSIDQLPDQDDTKLYTKKHQSLRMLQTFRLLKKAGMEISIQITVTAMNLDNIRKMMEFYEEEGVQEFRVSRYVSIKKKETDQDPFEITDKAWNDLIEELKNRFDHKVIPLSEGVTTREEEKICVNGKSCMVVLPDGIVCFCDYYRDLPGNYLGDLKKEMIQDIWHSNHRKEWVERHEHCYASDFRRKSINSGFGCIYSIRDDDSLGSLG